MEQQNCSEENNEFREPTLRREQPVRSEDLRGELQGEPEGFQPTDSRDDAEAWRDFWSIQGDFIHRHHIEPRLQLFVPKEETFPIPLKYIDATRATYTNLDVLQEKRPWWLLDRRRESKFVRILERIHEVHSMERKPSQGTHVVRGETNKISSNYQTW